MYRPVVKHAHIAMLNYILYVFHNTNKLKFRKYIARYSTVISILNISILISMFSSLIYFNNFERIYNASIK